jgi:hypothetical protein
MNSNQYTSGMQIDWETVDRITVSNLMQTYHHTKEFNDSIAISNSENPSKHFAEDYMYNMRLLDSLKVVLEYFGETV